jgi:hypothetical protein
MLIAFTAGGAWIFYRKQAPKRKDVGSVGDGLVWTVVGVLAIIALVFYIFGQR